MSCVKKKYLSVEIEREKEKVGNLKNPPPAPPACREDELRTQQQPEHQGEPHLGVSAQTSPGEPGMFSLACGPGRHGKGASASFCINNAATLFSLHDEPPSPHLPAPPPHAPGSRQSTAVLFSFFFSFSCKGSTHCASWGPGARSDLGK